MITAYYRPESIAQALQLLKNPANVPIGGGSTLAAIQRDVAVVDLQNLGLSKITEVGDRCVLGAAVTLESMLKYFSHSTSMEYAIKIEASRNQREQATIAGLVCSSDGRSPLLSLLLALDISIKWQPDDIEMSLGNFLAQRNRWQKGGLITEFSFAKDIKYGFESVGRSPFDLPIICIAAARWPSNRLRIVAGGLGSLPILVSDGNTSDNVELAVENALLDASDEWASAEYRIAAGRKIAARIKKALE